MLRLFNYHAKGKMGNGSAFHQRRAQQQQHCCYTILCPFHAVAQHKTANRDLYEFVLCTTNTNNNDFVVIEILIKPEGKVFRKIISLLIYKSLVNLSRAKATASIIETAQQRNY